MTVCVSYRSEARNVGKVISELAWRLVWAYIKGMFDHQPIAEVYYERIY